MIRWPVFFFFELGEVKHIPRGGKWRERGREAGAKVREVWVSADGRGCFGNPCPPLQSKKISNDQNWYNQIPRPALKTKREIIKYINWQQFTKGTRGKPNKQLFPKQVVIQLFNIYEICH